MTAYLFADLDIHDAQSYSEYPPLVGQFIEKHGEKLTHHISQFEALEDDWCPQRIWAMLFAGDRPEKAKYYPDNDQYLLEKEETCALYEVFLEK